MQYSDGYYESVEKIGLSIMFRSTVVVDWNEYFGRYLREKRSFATQKATGHHFAVLLLNSFTQRRNMFTVQSLEDWTVADCLLDREGSAHPSRWRRRQRLAPPGLSRSGGQLGRGARATPIPSAPCWVAGRPAWAANEHLN